MYQSSHSGSQIILLILSFEYQVSVSYEFLPSKIHTHADKCATNKITKSSLSKATMFVVVGRKRKESSIFLRTREKSLTLTKNSNVKMDLANV